MASSEVTWPSLIWARHQPEALTNQQARILTWPAPLQPPNDTVAAAHPQPNLYLQLTQILEWEIWNHNQTRAALHSQTALCEDLETHVQHLTRKIAQWEESCNTVYSALNEHRRENTALKHDMDCLSEELEYLRQRRLEREVPTLPPVRPGSH